MAYKKRNYGGKKYGSRKPNVYSRLARVGMKYSTKGGTAYKALKLARRVADAVNIEYKEFSNTFVSNPTYNGAISVINAIPVGTSFSTRVGDSLKMQNLTFRGLINAGAASDNVRVIIFIDKQNQITAGSNLLARAGGVFAPISEKQEDNKYVTRVLFDKLFQVIPTSAKGGYTFDEVIPLNLHTHFAAGTTNIVDNALKICFISGSLAASTCAINLVTTVSYTDN